METSTKHFSDKNIYVWIQKLVVNFRLNKITRESTKLLSNTMWSNFHIVMTKWVEKVDDGIREFV